MQYTEFSITQQGDLPIAFTANGKNKLEDLLVTTPPAKAGGFSDDA